MKTKSSFLFALVLGVVAPLTFAGPAAIPDNSKDKEIPVTQEQVCDPRWYISVGGGGDFDIGSSHFTNGFDRDFTVLANGGNGFFFPVPARLETRKLDWDDTHDTGWHGQGEIGYALTEHLELFGRFNYTHADSSGFTNLGTFSADVPLTGVIFPLRIKFDDYSAYGGELGFRFFLQPRQSRFRPYVALSGGVNHVDDIDATITADTTSFNGPADFRLYHGGFFDDSVVGTGAAMLGLEIKLTCHWDIGVEGGARYQTRLSQDNSDFRGGRAFGVAFGTPLQPLRQINDDAGDRWSVPVTGYLKFRF